MKIVDLSHTIRSGMMKFNANWHTATDIRKIGTIATVGRNTSEIRIGSHSGTHIDAESHFINGGETIENISLNKLIGPVKIFNFSSLHHDYCLKITDIDKLELSERVIFNFGWHKNWETDRFYKFYPHFSKEAAQYIVDRGVKVLGLDTPSPDDSKVQLLSENDSVIHKLLLSQGVTLIEYLANLDELDGETNWYLCALPLLICGGDGSPSRVCAFNMNNL
jgi:arylformamidase